MINSPCCSRSPNQSQTKVRSMTLRQTEKAWNGVSGNEKSTLNLLSEVLPSCSTTRSLSSTNWKLCTDGTRARPLNSNVYELIGDNLGAVQRQLGQVRYRLRQVNAL